MPKMISPKTPRYQGKITSWKDEQGFGFISPNGGGPAVFVHITAFSNRGCRPVDNDIATFNLGANGKGKPRAENVAYVRDRAQRQSSSGTGTASLFVAAIFLGIVAVCALVGKLPFLVFVFYLVMSVLAFMAYAIGFVA